MSLIQPSLRRFPKTAETLAESNLPFSLVVTPMKAPIERDPQPPLSPNRLGHHNYPLLTSIPKCMQCGAPHPTKQTHFWPHPYSFSDGGGHSFLVCYLCGGKTPNDRLPPPSPSTSDPRTFMDRQMPHIFQIPLISTSLATFWSLPALVCPPVCWFLLDGSCDHRSYWNTISYLLLETLADVPPHVHVGILLAATVPSSGSDEAVTTFNYVDLTSPVPHMLHFVQYAEEEEEPNDDELAGWGVGGLLDKMALVPADSLHLPNIHAAVRSLVDYDPSQLATTRRAHMGGMPLGKTVETILDFMDQAQHPGQEDVMSSSPSSLAEEEEGMDPLEDQILYAGGKIMAFLASCPTDLRGEDWRPLVPKNSPKTAIGLGGFGGAVGTNAPIRSVEANGFYETSWTPEALPADEETGFGTLPHGDDHEITDIDMTPASLLDYYRAPDHVEAYFQELGAQCAESALGVDIFVLVPPQVDDEYGMEYEESFQLDVGLPFLRVLADRSGAPGPLLFPLHQGYSTPTGTNPDIQRLRREIHARVPWGGYGGDGDENYDNPADLGHGRHHPMAFGGELRLRLSSSFVVDKSPIDEVDEGPQLATLYSSGGLMGPASVADETSNLWRLGTCDPFTSVTIDLDMKDKKAKDKLHVDGIQEIPWDPVIQTCFAYTTIIDDPEHPGQYLTVRQMRIASARVPLTDSVEALYSSVDPEVIGSVLFHKLTLTLLRDGLYTVQTIGEDWLKSLLVCAYKSAETQEAMERDQAELDRPRNDTNGDNDYSSLTFYANERLLDLEGELSAEDVLLAQGHEILKSLPLLVYALLHCDAIRPSSSIKGKPSSYSYYPTLDARCAAGAQMSSMNPPILAKCLTPQLQLWSCSQDLILDRLDLKMESIGVAVEEFGNDATTGEIRDDLVLFLNSPDCIVVCAVSYVIEKPIASKKSSMTVGPALQSAINAAIHGYRTPPEVIFHFGDINTNGANRIRAALIEDLPDNGGTGNFKEWKENLAGDVHDELENDE